MKLYKAAFLSSLLLSTGAYALTSQGMYNSSMHGFDYPKAKKDRVIKDVQIRLSELGYKIGEVDGVYGPQMRDILKEFQENQGIKVTGLIDNDTLRALNMAPQERYSE